MLSDESGPGRPMGSQPGLAEMKDRREKVGWRRGLLPRHWPGLIPSEQGQEMGVGQRGQQARPRVQDGVREFC